MASQKKPRPSVMGIMKYLLDLMPDESFSCVLDAFRFTSREREELARLAMRKNDILSLGGLYRAFAIVEAGSRKMIMSILRAALKGGCNINLVQRCAHRLGRALTDKEVVLLAEQYGKDMASRSSLVEEALLQEADGRSLYVCNRVQGIIQKKKDDFANSID